MHTSLIEAIGRSCCTVTVDATEQGHEPSWAVEKPLRQRPATAALPKSARSRPIGLPTRQAEFNDTDHLSSFLASHQACSMRMRSLASDRGFECCHKHGWTRATVGKRFLVALLRSLSVHLSVALSDERGPPLILGLGGAVPGSLRVARAAIRFGLALDRLGKYRGGEIVSLMIVRPRRPAANSHGRIGFVVRRNC